MKLPRDQRGLPCLPKRARPKHVQDMLDNVKRQGDYYDDYPKHYMLPEHGREYALLEYIGGLERLLDREFVEERWVVTWTSAVGPSDEAHDTRASAWDHVRELRMSVHARRGPVRVKHVKRFRIKKSEGT